MRNCACPWPPVTGRLLATADSSRNLTRLLDQASEGDRSAFDRLFPLVYDELRRLAQSSLRSERPDHTLSATSLVHEAYMKMVEHQSVDWQGRLHFFAVAAGAMRRVLIDYARARGRKKRGGGARPLSLDEVGDASGEAMTESQALELVMLDEAMTRLAEFNPEGAQVVEYRFFGGLATADIAKLLGTSEMTVRRRWMAAKNWLRSELDPGAFESLGRSSGPA